MSTYRYVISCIHANGEDIREMTAGARQITLATLRRHIEPEEWESFVSALGYDRSFPIRRDWHVGYFKGRYRGKPCYYVDHSRIEHIFCSA